MNYLTYVEQTQYPIVILVPQIKKTEITNAYIEPYNLDPTDIIVFDLYKDPIKKKTPIIDMKSYLADIAVQLDIWNSKYILVGDGDYFKTLTGVTTLEPHIGYVLPVLSEYGTQMAVYVPNYRSIFYNPKKINKTIEIGIEALKAYIKGEYIEPGNNIIKYSKYVKTGDKDLSIEETLDLILEENPPLLTVDIEAFSLDPTKAGIATIAFAWNKHEGVVLQIDYVEHNEDLCGLYIPNERNRSLLKNFFIAFNGNLTYHNASYDVMVLIYTLFMEGEITNTEGLLDGLEVMLKNWDDTKLITYLATNSCAGNELGLKAQAQEFAGNWAEDNIKDIRKIKLDNLMEYNLIDALATYYVLEKNYPKMVADQQEEIYKTIFKPALVDIIQMQLTGLPLNMERVFEIEKILQEDADTALNIIQSSYYIKQFVYEENERWVEMKNNTLKVKRVTMKDAKEVFNPSSNQQLQRLLFDMLALPVIDVTKTKQPATGTKILSDLINHTKDPLIIQLLTALVDYKSVEKVLSSFIPSFKKAVYSIKDNWHYLCGNYNIGGTISGRLSSSNP